MKAAVADGAEMLGSTGDFPPLESVVSGLRHAFQPIVHLDTGLTHGFEALLRGSDALGFESIADVFDKAAAAGMVEELEARLLDKALKDFAALSCAEGLHLFFNIDARSLPSLSRRTSAILDGMAKLGLSSTQLCLEVSERSDISQDSDATSALRQAREHGIQIALDDFGEGYARLRLLHEEHAEYVKFDRYFINNVARDPKKKLFVSSLIDMFEVLGIQTIAEGVETDEDLSSCRELGFDLVQGYLVARPTLEHESLSRSYETLLSARRRDRRARTSDQHILREQIIEVPTLDIDTPMQDVFDAFRTNQSARLFPVLDVNGRPLGIVRDVDLKAYAFSPYGKDLIVNRSFGKRLGDFVRPCPIADIHTQAERILQIYSHNDTLNGVIIVENASYVGFLDNSSLLRVLNEKNLIIAREMNPLTKLPGNTSISDYIADALTDTEESCALLHFDFDNFKPFNDTYGFRQGDRALLLFAENLRQTFAGPEYFVGHIGGDDFFVGTRGADMSEVSKLTYAARQQFAEDVESFYDKDARERGSIEARGRDGKLRSYPLLTCSAAMLVIEAGRRHSDLETVLTAFAELKKRAKEEGGFAFHHIQ
ncbi:GGDEF domain-containing protein [Nisaea acidiphila]|uniref:GGDEF domain-containing protein n=1 Tax=Nisaea acidiphila TaxID=1862145 RepID=A0A9J7ANR2_9PROT|nr:GGDEF domain-containing protein [Nisaea acidiphila]UUX48233.1 GGDEF domain-containing protein [Nisaea acidiphila]